MHHDRGAFVDIQWLQDNRTNPQLRIVDARNVPHGVKVTTPSGQQQYELGHLPAAIYLDYAAELADSDAPYATRIASAQAFARAVEAKGIGDDSIVIAYDAGTIPFAARIVWNFHYFGHRQAYILAGGIGEWVAGGGVPTTDIPNFVPAVFTPDIQPYLRASLDEVIAVAQGRSTAQLLETQRDTTYALRDRDVSGAIRLSGSLLLEDSRGGRIADAPTLERLIAQRRLEGRNRTIVSCGSGVSAAGAYFALRAAGFTDVAVYDGSWLEWEYKRLPTTPKAPGAV